MEANQRPVPIGNELSAPFWEAARAGQLCVQRCNACKRFQHPPESECLQCGSSKLAFTRVSGEATVYSFSVVRESITPGMLPPYTVLVAQLAEQPDLKMLGSAKGILPLKIGQKLKVVFERISDSTTIPQFVPAD